MTWLYDAFSNVLHGLLGMTRVPTPGAPRLPGPDDIGKVFVSERIEPHPNFGKYKVLLSTDSASGYYAFNTFDLIDGKPVGKNLVSYAALPVYREVVFDAETRRAADAAIEEANARQRTSFQEFMRTYVPPTPPPIEDPFEVETVCPICVEVFPAGEISRSNATCPACASEAIECEVQVLHDYLSSKALADLDEMLTRWEAAEGFLPEYQKVKADRIRELRARKLAGR